MRGENRARKQNGVRKTNAKTQHTSSIKDKEHSALSEKLNCKKTIILPTRDVKVKRSVVKKTTGSNPTQPPKHRGQ